MKIFRNNKMKHFPVFSGNPTTGHITDNCTEYGVSLLFLRDVFRLYLGRKVMQLYCIP